MNRITVILFAAVLVLVSGARVKSQSIFAAKSPVQQLTTIKAANQVLLDKQTAALLKLEDLLKEASQVKFLSKRG
jgi:hypothetical protein